MEQKITLNGIAIEDNHITILQGYAKEYSIPFLAVTKPSLVGRIKLFIEQNPDKNVFVIPEKPSAQKKEVKPKTEKTESVNQAETSNPIKEEEKPKITKPMVTKKTKAKKAVKKTAPKKVTKKAVKKVAAKKVAKKKEPKPAKAKTVKAIKPVKDGKNHKLNDMNYNDGSGVIKSAKLEKTLSDKEQHIMTILLDKKEEYVKRETICKKIWPEAFVKNEWGTGRNLDNYINRLRRTFEQADKTVHLIYNRTEGYMISTKKQEAKK